MERLVKRIPYLGFLTALVVLVAVGGFAINSLNGLMASNRMVLETVETLDELEVIQGLVAQVETSEEGYIITGDATYLDLYQSAASAEGLPAHLNRLRELTTDNPAQQARLAQLEPLITDHLAQVQSLIDLRRTQGFEPARQMIASGVTFQKSADIRARLSELDEAEDNQLEAASSIENARVQEVITTLLIGTLLIIALSTSGVVVLNREVSQRQQAEEKLQQLNEGLEVRVQQRTAELEQTNAQLQAQAVKRQETQETLTRERSLLRTVIDNMADQVFVKDRQGKFLVANAAVVKARRFDSEAELMGKSDLDLFPGEEGERYYAAEQALLESGQGYTDPDFYVDLVGEIPQWIQITKVPLRDGSGQVIGLVGLIHDITERKKAEQALLEERNLLRTVIDNLPDQVFVKDRQSRFLAVNSVVLKELGVKSESDIIGKSDLDLFEREVAEGYFATEQALMDSGQALINQDIHYLKLMSQTMRWLQVNKVPLRDNAGQVIGLVGLTRDVTEQKLAEENLRDSEAHYHLMFESNPLPMWVFDVETLAFVSVNEAAIYHYGYTRKEFLGMTIKDIRPAEEIPAMMASVMDAAEGRRKTGVWRHRKKDGTLIDVEIFSHDLPFAGRPARLVLANDITERKQAEAAQTHANLMFRALFDNSPDSIVLIDPQGEWPILDCNEAACVMNGYSRTELLGKPINILNADPNALTDRAGFFESLRAVKNVKYETVHRRKDGTIFPIEVSTTLLEIEGQALVLGIDRDITERKRRLRELEAIAAVSGALRAAETRQEMLPVILDQLMSLLEAEGAAIDMKDPATGDAVTELGRGAWAGLSGQRHLANEPSITNQLIASGEPYLNNDLKAESHLNQSALVGTIRAVAALPLVTAQQNHIGALWLGRSTAFSQAEVTLFGSVADIAATAINRAILHEQTGRHLQNLAALRDIDRAIASSLDLKLTLAVVLGHVVKQLEVDAAAVLLHVEGRQALLYTAGVGFRGTAIKQSNVRLGEEFAGRAALERKILHITNFAGLRPGNLAMLLAADGFVDYYAVPLIAKGKVSGVLELFHRHNKERDPEWLEFLNALAGQTAIAIDNVQLFENLQRSNMELALAYDATIEGWSKALDLRDKETEGHSQRVTEMTLQLARAMGMNEEALVHVRRGALLHDIGKMGVPDNILLKPEALTEAEWVRMKEHPAFAYSLLSPVNYLRPALDIPYCHHEKWDGSGYPRGLKGEEIPLAARVFAVVDVWDALRSDRPYREGWPVEKVRAHIQDLSGSHFDPAVVTVFLGMV